MVQEKVLARGIIDQARQRFDGQLHTAEYRRIHTDETHLNSLMNFIEVFPDKKYIDLGTGNGYLAFEMANRHSETPDLNFETTNLNFDTPDLNFETTNRNSETTFRNQCRSSVQIVV